MNSKQIEAKHTPQVPIPEGYEILGDKMLQKEDDLILTSGVFTPLSWKPIGSRSHDVPYFGARCGIFVVRKITRKIKAGAAQGKENFAQ